MMKYKLLLVVNLFFLSLFSSAQDIQPVQFSFDKVKTTDGEFELRIKAKPAAGIQLFSTQKISEDLPVNTIISFDTAAKIFLRDSIKETGALKTAVDASANNATRQTNAIDPTVVTAPDGRQFFYYGSAWDGIYVLELDPATGLAKKGGDIGTRIANRGFTDGRYNGNIEGPEVIYNK